MYKIVILLILFNFILVKSDTIKIAADDYEPYIKINEREVSGILIEIVTKSFEKSKIDVNYKKYPWKRAYELTKITEIDASIPWFRTQSREEDFIFSDEIIFNQNKFFVFKGRNIKEDFEWKNLEDFKKYKVGGVIGFWYEESFEKAGLKAEMVGNDFQNFQKLKNNRIDTLIVDERVGWFLITQNYPENINDFFTITKPESEDTLHLIVSKKHPKGKEIIEKFNEGLKKLKKSGEYDKIINRNSNIKLEFVK